MALLLAWVKRVGATLGGGHREQRAVIRPARVRPSPFEPRGRSLLRSSPSSTEHDTGELMIGDSESGAKGAVFVERKRACWGAARGAGAAALARASLRTRQARNERPMEPLYLACKKEAAAR